MIGALKRKRSTAGTASTTTGGTDAEDVPRKVLRPIDNYAESTTLKKVETTAKIQQNRRTQKIPDNARLMLAPESPENTNEKDSIFAQNFMDKVNETYLSEKNSNKISEFIHILQDFDQANGKASELYHKMENFFLPDHPELTDIFLTFLTPGEAAQIGKFMEHFMLTNMSNFINKLKKFCFRKPAQLLKIVTCLTELSNKPDVQMTHLLNSVLPLLKGNPFMIKWFMQCFPNDDCFSSGMADIDSEYETLNFYRALETMDDTDVYELIPHSEILPDPVDNPCQIRYQSGKIYFGRKMLLPAKLSFMIPHANYNVDEDESPERLPNLTSSDEATGSEQLHQYRCVHAFKPYGQFNLRAQQCGNQFNISDSGSGNSGGLCEESLNLLPSCCDNMTQKAHALRLNPKAYATELIKANELLDLLKPASASQRLSNTETESLQITTKKQYTSNSNELTNILSDSISSSCNEHASSNTIDDYSDDDADGNEEEEDSLSSWSRQEDKILLEHIKMGCITEDALVREFRNEPFLNRDLQDIRDRFKFLLDVISNL